MNILIVKYLPGNEISKTKELYSEICRNLLNFTLTEIDLEKQKPEFYNNASLMAYYQRNFQHGELNNEQINLLSKADYFAKLVKDSDLVILVSPMHNFGMPAIIKAWFDNVMQKGVAFEYGEKGPYGLFKGKKALVVYTNGGVYSFDKFSPNYPDWDTYKLLATIEFKFMGFDDIKIVSASTGNAEFVSKNLYEAKNEISSILSSWLK